MTIEHLKSSKRGRGNGFNLIRIRFKDHMWLVTHVSDNAGREIAVSILIFSLSFQQALLNVYKVAVSFLFGCLKHIGTLRYQAALASSRIEEAVTVLCRDRQDPSAL